MRLSGKTISFHWFWAIGFLSQESNWEPSLTAHPQPIYDDQAMRIPSPSLLRASTSLLLTAILGFTFAAAQTPPRPNPQLASKEVNARVEALLKQMTLDEKVG